MIKLVRRLDTNTENTYGCGICPRECELMDGGVCRAGVRRRLGRSLAQLNYGMVTNLQVRGLPKEFSSKEKALYVTMLGGNTFSRYDDDDWVTHFYHSRAFEIGKLKALQEIESSGEYYSPDDLVEYAKINGVNMLLFYNGEPAVNIDYIYDVAIAAKDDGLGVWLKSSGSLQLSCWAETNKEIAGISLKLNSLDISFNHKHYGYPTEHILSLINSSSKRGKLHSIHTLLIPGVNDKINTIKALRDQIGSLPSPPNWVITELDQYPGDEEKIARGRLEELLRVASEGKAVNIITDTGRI